MITYNQIARLIHTEILLLAVFVLSAISLNAQVVMQDIQFDANFSSQGINSRIPLAMDVQLYIPSPEDANIEADVKLNLSALLGNLQDILNKEVSYYDECGERLRVTGVRLEDVRGGKLLLKVSLNYQVWECFLGAKTRILSQSGDVFLELSPAPFNRGLKIHTRVIRVSASGVLSSLVESNSDIRRKLIKMISREMPQGFEKALPDQFDNIPTFEIQTPKFRDGPVLELKIRARAHRDVLMKHILDFQPKPKPRKD